MWLPTSAQPMFSKRRGLMFLSSVEKGKIDLELMVSWSLGAFSVCNQLHAWNFHYLCFMPYTIVKSEWKISFVINLALIKACNLLGRIFGPRLLHCGRVLTNCPVEVTPCWGLPTQNLVQMLRLMMIHTYAHQGDVKMFITYKTGLLQG